MKPADKIKEIIEDIESDVEDLTLAIQDYGLEWKEIVDGQERIKNIAIGNGKTDVVFFSVLSGIFFFVVGLSVNATFR